MNFIVLFQYNVFSKAGQFAPEPPLILSSWWDTPPLEKSKRFIEHLEWACSGNFDLNEVTC